MEYFMITGGHPLEGIAPVHGAKNSALPILAATLLAKGESVIHNCPDLTDVQTALDILENLGCRVRREGDTVMVDTSCAQGTRIPDHLMSRMRASVLFLGALLAREGCAEAGWPGGCALGARPIDLHLAAFQALGARVEDREEHIICRGRTLHGTRLTLPIPSVGATENAMLAACGAEGVTILQNPAREPEIADLQGFLQAMGADVEGAGTDRILIRGGRPLRPASYRVMADRIVTATYLCSVASAGGEGIFTGTDGGHLLPVLEALTAAGCTIRREPGRILIRKDRPLAAVHITTGPYPAFPTDAQPLLAAALAGGVGESTITETIFDRRFRYVQGLDALGAEICLEGNTARITGRPLHGGQVTAPDLRGGAALVIAALGAEGESRITGLSHIQRGYEGLEDTLQMLGASIRRTKDKGT